MKLDDAIQTLAGREGQITEQRVTQSPVMTSSDTVMIGSSTYRLGEQGLARLGGHVSAPAAYLSRLVPNIRQLVLQSHFEHDFDTENLTVIARDGELLGFGRADLLRIGVPDVLHAVQDGAKQELTVHDLQIFDESVQADLLLEGVTEEVAPGDVLEAGLRVTHSFVGDHATYIESYIRRLICSNGLTHRECSRKRSTRTRRLPIDHKDAYELQVAQVRRLAQDATGALRRKLLTIGELQRERVDVDQLLTRWLERARLSPRSWLPTLREAWETEGSQATAFGVMNALTRVATHNTQITLRQRRVLSGLAGLLAFQRIHLCPRCFSQLGGHSAIRTDDIATVGEIAADG